MGYILEEADNTDFVAATVLYTGTETQYQVSGQDGGVWHYRVRASNGTGEGPWSNTESVAVVRSQDLTYRAYLPLLLNGSMGGP